MPTNNDEAKKKIEQLKQLYIKSINDKIEQITGLEEEIEKNPDKLKAVEELAKIIHKIAGTSGMYALDEISTVANEFELYLKPYAKSLQPIEEIEPQKVKDFCSRLYKAVINN